jgi:hypothetical protein
MAKRVSVGELGDSSKKLIPFVQLRNQEQCQIGPSRSSAHSIGLPLDIKNQIHGLLYQVRISSQTFFCNLRLQVFPLFDEPRLRSGISGAIDGWTRLKPFPGRIESLDNDPVALVDRNLTAERIHSQHQFSGLEQFGALGVVWISRDGRLEVPLSNVVAA